MMKFDSAVTEKQIALLDKVIKIHTPSWRMAYIMLTKDSDTLQKFCTDADDETLESMIDAFKACNELFEAMAADLKCALCRLIVCCEERERQQKEKDKASMAHQGKLKVA